MNPTRENNSQGSVKLRTQLYKIKYFRSKKQFEQYKMFYGGNPNPRDLQSSQKYMQARSSDARSQLQNRLSIKRSDYSANYLHTPGITYGIRPGLGKPMHYCDCSKTVSNRISTNSVVTALVSIQYLTLMCTSYCIKRIKQRNHRAKLSNANGQWKPSYIPYPENEYSNTDKSYDEWRYVNILLTDVNNTPPLHNNKHKNVTSSLPNPLNITLVPPKMANTPPNNDTTQPPIATTMTAKTSKYGPETNTSDLKLNSMQNTSFREDTDISSAEYFGVTKSYKKDDEHVNEIDNILTHTTQINNLTYEGSETFPNDNYTKGK